MKEEEKKALEEFFANDFSPSEQERILLEFPSLPQDAELLHSYLEALRSQPVPELRRDFSERVMASLGRPPLWETLRAGLGSWRRIALVSSLSAAVLALLLVGPRLWTQKDAAILVREEILENQEKRYQVRFAIRMPDARTVEVAGDFNQWNPVALQPSVKKDGTFSLELPLGEGTYSYAFLVDGKKWIPDPAASRKISDGFGNVNSLINL